MKLRILSTTDVHGAIFPTNYTSIKQLEKYSLAHVSTLVKRLREDGDILLIDNGDSFQGTPLLTYAHRHIDSIENPMATAFNTMNYDYINLGNHDFNYGPKVLRKYIEECDAPLLTGNVLEKNTPVGSTQIIDREGKKIALVGALTHYIPNWERAAHIEDFSFIDAYSYMKEEVARIKNEVDYVIGVYHGGFEKDIYSGEPTETLTGENQGYDMTTIDGLDILITGHQHRTLIGEVNNCFITQTSLKAKECSYIELDLETGEITGDIISLENYEADLELLSLFIPLQDKVQLWLDESIGEMSSTAPSLIVEDVAEARLNKHPLVSFINQVQLETTGADISGVALFNGSKGFNPTISMRDLVTTYIYPNTLVTKKITGKTLKEILELCANFFDVDGTNITVSKDYEDPKPQHYNYDMFDGIEYTIKASNPRGSRILDLKRNGNLVKNDDSFILATNNYRATGGGNFGMIKDSETIQDFPEEMVDVLMRYFEDNSPIGVQHNNNIKVIY